MRFNNSFPNTVLFLEKNYPAISLEKKIKLLTLSKSNLDYDLILPTLYRYFKYSFRYSIKFLYLLNIIQKYRPKIIIGNQFNSYLFQIKNFYPKINTIMYFHFAMINSQINEYIIKNLNGKRKNIDYVLLPNLKTKKYLKKYIRTNFVVSGFLKNNEIKLKKTNKIYDLMIISEYRNELKHEKKVIIDKALKKLSKIINKKKLKVCIALVSSREEKNIEKEKELSFFKRFNFKFEISKLNSYEIASRSKIIFSINSNLGYELLSRKFKVLFYLNGQKFYLNNYPFICNSSNLENFFDKLYRIKSENFKRIFKSKNANFIYDKNNKTLKKLINKIL